MLLSNIKIRFLKYLYKYCDHPLWGKAVSKFLAIILPPFIARVKLLNRLGSKVFISPSADIYHSKLKMGDKIYIDDNVTIFEDFDGGPISIGNYSKIYRYTIMQTGQGGRIEIADETVVHPRCQFFAHIGPIKIEKNVLIAPNCSFYSYNHGFNKNENIKDQPLTSKGGILINEDVWLGVGVIVLDGVDIGRGAVIGAGSVVTHSIPEYAIAAGNPARVIGKRD